MRGAPDRLLNDMGNLGIIPAYAGSTSALVFTSNLEKDHPRVCGEHPCQAMTTLPSRGSSPRMRGAHEKVESIENNDRIIPAYAGSTEDFIDDGDDDEDHPRVCGEHG